MLSSSLKKRAVNRSLKERKQVSIKLESEISYPVITEKSRTTLI